MNASDLKQQLNSQYSTYGVIDVSELENPAYTSVFDKLGIPYRISILDDSGKQWQQTNDTIYFSGTINGESSVLGLFAGNSIRFEFQPESGNDNIFQLLITLYLPDNWHFGDSFEILNISVYNQLSLIPKISAAGDSIITILANTNTAQEPADFPPLNISAYINQNSSIFTVLTWFISGGVQNPIHGPISYLAATGAVEMQIPLATSVVNSMFGNSIPELDFSLSLYCAKAIDSPIYEAGIAFETDIVLGSSPVAFRALFNNSSLDAVNLSVTGLSLSFTQISESLEDIFGNLQPIISALPDAITSSQLTVKELSVRINLKTLDVFYSNMVVAVLENTVWNIWPGYISISDIEFSFTIMSPFSNPGFDFHVSGHSVFGGNDGIPLFVSAQLPALVLDASLDTEYYSLKSLTNLFFNADKGIPDNLFIDELEFKADISNENYFFNLDVLGNWKISFGHDNELVIENIFVHLEYDSIGGAYGTLAATFDIGANEFIVELNLSLEDQVFYLKWIPGELPIDYQDIAIGFGMYGLPNIPGGIDLELSEVSIQLETAGPSASVAMLSKKYGGAGMVLGKDASGNWGFIFGLMASLDLNIDLTNVDIIGNFVPDSMDNIEISELRFVGATSAIPVYTPTPGLTQILGPEINSGLVLSANLKIGTLLNETFTVRYGGLNDGSASDVPPTITNNQNNGNEGNNPPTNNAVQLDTTPSQPAAMPGPTSSWINVQRSFGPVHISRIGFRITDDNSLGVLLDAEVNLAGLTIGFDALEADIPVQSPYWPSFSLAGLEIGYIAPGLIIAGGLQKTYGVTPVQYTGELIIQAAGFGASAFGSYTTVNNEPSLFAFLALNVPLGGPPFFVVTGLSMGFGYNRQLILPTIENVQTYPLVQAAMGITDPQATINALNQYIVPADNQYWLAAGIRFTSFEMLNAYALLTASFGTQVELALMGEAMLTLPLAVPGEEEIILAQADMVLLASITPSLGQVAISAQLTSRSYILDKNAQITGGFAFYFWFGKSKHAGDFVVTLGGYNPHFQKPSYYPAVPQLGLNWKISNLISIKGGLYAALTPSVIMAGGNLQASYSSGDVSASFTANADFLIRFKPFYFESQIAVSVSASYKLNLLFTTKKVTVTVGAQLNLWGPPFAGTATVDLSIFSFTIAFGAAKSNNTSNILWPEFRNSFLPPDPGTTTLPASQGTEQNPLYTHSLIRFNADSGLISSSETGSNNETSWRVDPGKTSISIGTSVPTKTLNVSAVLSNTLDPSSIKTDFGIGPMGADPSATSVVTTIKIYYEEGNEFVSDTINIWEVVLITEQIPAGLWLNKTNSMTGSSLFDDALTGIQLIPQPHHADVVAPIDESQLLHSNPIVRSASWSAATAENEQNNQSQAMETMQNTITDASVENTRTSILNALIAQGLSTSTEDEISLDSFAEDAENMLYAAPLLCGLGQTQF